MTSPSNKLIISCSRLALSNATASSIASAENEVRYAVQLIAALARQANPNAKRVELEGSDQGDFLHVTSVDGDEELADLITEDESNPAWCIYDAHRAASPALHSINPKRPLYRTDELYIDIDEALKGMS